MKKKKLSPVPPAPNKGAPLKQVPMRTNKMNLKSRGSTVKAGGK